MQFCGIHDKDLIFVKGGFKITDLDLSDFPYILVLRTSNSATDKNIKSGHSATFFVVDEGNCCKMSKFAK